MDRQIASGSPVERATLAGKSNQQNYSALPRAAASFAITDMPSQLGGDRRQPSPDRGIFCGLTVRRHTGSGTFRMAEIVVCVAGSLAEPARPVVRRPESWRLAPMKLDGRRECIDAITGVVTGITVNRCSISPQPC